MAGDAFTEQPGDRWVHTGDLVSAADVATHRGVPVERLEEMVASGELVEPVARLATDVRRWVWSHTEVESGIEQGLMTATEVAELAGYSSPSTVWDLVKKGNMPPPVRQVGRVKLYPRAEVVEYLAAVDRRRPR